MVPLERLGVAYYSHTVVTVAVSCIISQIKLDIFENRDFSYPACIRRLVKILQYCHSAWCGKNYSVVAIRQCKKFHDMFSRFDRIPGCDRQTDKQKDILWQHSPHCA